MRIDSVMAERDRPYVGVYGTLTEADKRMGVFCVWLGLPFRHLVLATDVTVQSDESELGFPQPSVCN